MKASIYNQSGEKVSEMELPSIFSSEWNADLVHQVVTSLQSNMRVKVAHVKDRGEVSGSGKKPWRQKGTGRARHGSKRSPIWIGGGVAHGPNPLKDYSKKINKKMKKAALNMILSKKLEDNEILFLDKVNFDKIKTKEANEIIKNLSQINGFEKLLTKKKNRAIIVIGKKDEKIKRVFANIPGILVKEEKNLNVLDVLNYKYLIFIDYNR